MAFIEGEAAGGGVVSGREAEASIDVLVFAVGPLRFALPAAGVEELTPAFAIEPLPGAPAVVAGAANLRGAILPVFDLRARVGMEGRELDVADHFVVARAGARRVVLHVDRALELRAIATQGLAELGELPVANPVLSGAVATEDGVLLVYDLARFLEPGEAAALDQALAAVERRS